MKKLVLLILTFYLTGCGLFGWDSSGGNNPADGLIGAGMFVLLVVPDNYPYQGYGEISESTFGDVVIIDLNNDLNSIYLESLSDDEMLRIVNTSCDQTANQLNEIIYDSDEVIVDWTNENSDEGSLSISRQTFSDSEMRIIECLL